MSRWPVGIAVGLGLMVLVNFVFIYLSIQNAPQIETSYETTPER